MVSRRRRWRSGVREEWNDGCFVPPTYFFSITSSIQLNSGKGAALWFDASLLITMPAPWSGCFTPAALHYYFGMARGPGCLMSHMSAKGTRTFMKASAQLLRRRSTRHGDPVNRYLYCSTTIVLLFARPIDTNSIKQARAEFFLHGRWYWPYISKAILMHANWIIISNNMIFSKTKNTYDLLC